METKNLFLPSLSNRKCVGLGLLNRVPEADLELKMYEIRRDYVKFKENTRHEEGKIWDELYNNHRELRQSYVSKYSREEVLHNKELFYLPRVPSYSPDSPSHDSPAETPFAEKYKQFVTFKADTMRHMHLRQSEKRPNYMDLYARQFDKKHKNQDNFHKVLVKFEEKRKKGHGPLNILKNKEGTTSTKPTNPSTTESGAGSSFEEAERSSGGRQQDGFSSREISGARMTTVKDQTHRKRKLAVTNREDLPEKQHHQQRRMNTLSTFDVGLGHAKSHPPQLTKFPTLAGGPKKA